MGDTLIVDGGWAGRLLQLTLPREAEAIGNFVCFVDAEPHERQNHPERLAALVRLFHVGQIVLTSSNDSLEETTRAAQALEELGTTVDIVRNPQKGEEFPTQADNREAMFTIGLPRARISRPTRIVKRAADIVGALLGLLVVSPLFAYVWWRVKRDSPGHPVFARRRCLGMGMTEFAALDFRTTNPRVGAPSQREYLRQMLLGGSTDDQATGGGHDPDEDVTPFGRRLRDSGLAELPRLINVLRGDMSLVGPRPCDVHERDVFEPHHFERFLVPAGLTGPLQSSPQGQIPYTAGLEMEVAYSRARSLKGDAALLFRMVGGRIRSHARS
jgi:lipopolysaccharide/colanic/teichoic acid biosynthesis glycosyltransferase